MRGMKWITKMVMEMVLVLTVVLMETLEGDGGAFRGDSDSVPPPPILSGGSLLSPVLWFLCFYAASLRNSLGDYFL